MSTPVFSVVIPTRNRASTLARTLGALARQRAAPPFEVLVVDDGSSPAIAEAIADHRPAFPTRVLAQPPLGPAAARNLGFARSIGEWIAFLGSDTAPEPDWLAALWSGLRAQPSGRQAIIGRTDWHPSIRATAFLRYINEHGLQFGFALIDDPEDVAFNFFYGSNSAVHRRWLEQHRFDERFRDAAWEDTEIAYRMTRAGLRVAYRPEARVLHDHSMDLAAFLRRQQRVGRSAVVFRALHPELSRFLRLPARGAPRVPPRTTIRLLERLARSLEARPVELRRVWRWLARAHYLRGCADAVAAGMGIDPTAGRTVRTLTTRRRSPRA